MWSTSARRHRRQVLGYDFEMETGLGGGRVDVAACFLRARGDVGPDLSPELVLELGEPAIEILDDDRRLGNGPVQGLVAKERDIADRFYFGDVVQRQIFSRSPRPSVAITIQRS